MRNILVQYRGGGYSGNFWEWNFFWIDKQGQFHNIFSSGREGIETKERAFELLEQDESSTYVYHLDNPDDLRVFATKTHSTLVVMVVQYFRENENNLTSDEYPYCVCEVCGAECFFDDITQTEDGIVCSDCYGAGICDNCGEYYGAEFIIRVDPKRYDDHYALCGDCKEEIEETNDMLPDDELKDLFFQAMCTGEPDMFDEQFRCLWRIN